VQTEKLWSLSVELTVGERRRCEPGPHKLSKPIEADSGACAGFTYSAGGRVFRCAIHRSQHRAVGGLCLSWQGDFERQKVIVPRRRPRGEVMDPLSAFTSAGGLAPQRAQASTPTQRLLFDLEAGPR